MKKLSVLIVLTLLAFGYLQKNNLSVSDFTSPTISLSSSNSSSAIENAIQNQKSNIQIAGQGVVSHILADDLQGSRHQRFILTLSSDDTLLVAHNIDLAPKITSLAKGDIVEFYGEYEWNNKGGVIHWTHHDPSGRHIGGWLKHRDKTYQ